MNKWGWCSSLKVGDAAENPGALLNCRDLAQGGERVRVQNGRGVEEHHEVHLLLGRGAGLPRHDRASPFLDELAEVRLRWLVVPTVKVELQPVEEW